MKVMFLKRYVAGACAACFSLWSMSPAFAQSAPAPGASAPSAPAQALARPPFASEAPAAAAASMNRPVSASAQTQEERLEEMLATFDDDDLYEVNEGSMTDFDRAMK